MTRDTSPPWSVCSIRPEEEPAAEPLDGPLAARMRPRTLAEFVGQEHLLGEGSALRASLESGSPHSMVLYGPPGTGKTTLARLAAEHASAAFEELSAVNAGRPEVREVIARATERRRGGRATIFFLDEIHRFNKAQQDALLPAVEEGLLTLIGATTENPYFEVNSALLSRAQVYELQSLDAEDLEGLLRRALERGAGEGIEVPDEVITFLAVRAGGDARTALNALELAVDDGAARAGAARHARRRRGRAAAQGRALRQGRRPALRLHLGLDQVDARLGPRRVAVLPRRDGRGRRGPALHRPPHDRARLRGHRQRRPAGAPDRGRRGARGRARRLPRGGVRARPGGDLPVAGAEVRRRQARDGRGPRLHPRARDQAAAGARCARRPTRRRASSAAARATTTRTATPATSTTRSTCPRGSRACASTSRTRASRRRATRLAESARRAGADSVERRPLRDAAAALVARPRRGAGALPAAGGDGDPRRARAARRRAGRRASASRAPRRCSPSCCRRSAACTTSPTTARARCATGGSGASPRCARGAARWSCRRRSASSASAAAAPRRGPSRCWRPARRCWPATPWCSPRRSRRRVRAAFERGGVPPELIAVAEPEEDLAARCAARRRHAPAAREGHDARARRRAARPHGHRRAVGRVRRHRAPPRGGRPARGRAGGRRAAARRARGGRAAAAPRRPAPPRHRGRPAALRRDPRAGGGARRRGGRRRRDAAVRRPARGPGRRGRLLRARRAARREARARGC